MLNLIIFGGPGSGKGTQSERLIERFGLFHISTGQVLRQQIAEKTELGIIADSYISKGQLIPDDLMLKVLEHVLDTHPEEVAKGVIFDGFPRTIAQAEALDVLLEKRGTKIDAVIGLEVPDDELIQRMIRRGQETGRADDNFDTIRERLVVYHTVTIPLRDYYIGKEVYLPINGTGNIDDIFNSIVDALDATE